MSNTEKVVKGVRRKFFTEEIICIILDGPRGEVSITDLCRRGGINSYLYYRLSKDFLDTSPKYLWLHSGIRHDEAAADVESRGVVVYQDLCIKQTHKRLAQANILKH